MMGWKSRYGWCLTMYGLSANYPGIRRALFMLGVGQQFNY
jgi:hypothetical protein